MCIEPEYIHNRLAAGISPSTIRTYTNRLEAFQRFVGNLSNATTRDLEEFLAKRRHLASESRKSFRTAFRSYYSWLNKCGRISNNPAANLEPIPVRSAIPRVADDNQLIYALQHCSNRDRALILLGRLACLRLSEITHLHMKDRIEDTLNIFGKGDKWRQVPINLELMEILLILEVEQPYGYYFPSQRNPLETMHPMSVNKIITRVTGTNPHSLRHAGAMAAYRQTKDLRAVQLLLGHSSIATTQRYLGFDVDAVRRAANATQLNTSVPAVAQPQRHGLKHLSTQVQEEKRRSA